MRYKSLFLGLAAILAAISGIYNWWPEQNPLRSPKSLLPERSQVQQIDGVFNEKEGWGFVRSRDGQGPEVTARQKALVQKYDALFLGDTGKKQVTLTFDMGYEKEGFTPRILDILAKYNVKGSFFVTTNWIEKNPEIVKRLVKEGHVLGNHTVRHKSLPTLSDGEVKEEITGWEEIAKQVVGNGIDFKYMRPPMGEYSERTLKITKELGYRTAFWSVAIKDWLPMGGPGEAVKGTVSQLHNGAVILLHGNSDDSVGGLEQIILSTREKGYKIVPINEI